MPYRSDFLVACGLLFTLALPAAGQPRLNTPTDTVVPETNGNGARSARSFSSYARLARAPNMFGDWFSGLGQAVVRTEAGNVITDLPQAGGRMPRVVENNKPLPMDRVYFLYNGFQNAAAFGPPAGPTREVNVNRYTFGGEKTFNDETASLEVRMPLSDGFGFANDAFTLDSGYWGNLSLFLKQLVYEDESFAAAMGLGLSLPTGSDLEARFNAAPFTVRNEAYHLLPYVGFLATPDSDWFLQGFLQIDFAANGNTVDFGPGGTSGVFTEQNLFLADLSLGRWLYQNDSVDYFPGLAAVVELHYASTLQDADAFALQSDGFAASFANLSSPGNRFDVLNLTVGLNLQVTALSDFRVGAVVPLRGGFNRQFDSEIQVSFNRYF